MNSSLFFDLRTIISFVKLSKRDKNHKEKKPPNDSHRNWHYLIYFMYKRSQLFLILSILYICISELLCLQVKILCRKICLLMLFISCRKKFFYWFNNTYFRCKFCCKVHFVICHKSWKRSIFIKSIALQNSYRGRKRTKQI